MASRAYTAEELRYKFLQAVRGNRDYWLLNDRADTIEKKLDGLCFSILTILDGVGCSDECRFDLVAHSHPSDKADAIEEGKNWVEDGTVVSFMFHEYWHIKPR